MRYWYIFDFNLQSAIPYLVVMNIEKNFALGTEKFINFHCLSQYLQSGLDSHPGQTSPYRRSTGETLNWYSLWRQSPGLAKCSQARQGSLGWMTELAGCFYLCVRRYLGNFIRRFVCPLPWFWSRRYHRPVVINFVIERITVSYRYR